MTALHHRIRVLLLIGCAGLLTPTAAVAADLYLSGQLAMAGGLGRSGGSVDLGAGGSYANTGSDSDSSPVFGGAFGYAFPLNEMFPADWDWPLPDWGALRVELEGLGGRDYELVTRGPDPYLTRISNWAVMNNLWADLPVHPAFSWWLGRIPLLEPMTFYAGAGIGLGGTELSVTNNVFRGSKDALDFTWQAGAGLGYRLTDRVSVSLGYRYAALGDFDVALYNPPAPDPVGDYRLDLQSHELTFGLRVALTSVPSPGAWSVRPGR